VVTLKIKWSLRKLVNSVRLAFATKKTSFLLNAPVVQKYTAENTVDKTITIALCILTKMTGTSSSAQFAKKDLSRTSVPIMTNSGASTLTRATVSVIRKK